MDGGTKARPVCGNRGIPRSGGTKPPAVFGAGDGGVEKRIKTGLSGRKPAKGSRENPAVYYKAAGKQGEKV